MTITNIPGLNGDDGLLTLPDKRCWFPVRCNDRLINGYLNGEWKAATLLACIANLEACFFLLRQPGVYTATQLGAQKEPASRIETGNYGQPHQYPFKNLPLRVWLGVWMGTGVWI